MANFGGRHLSVFFGLILCAACGGEPAATGASGGASVVGVSVGSGGSGGALGIGGAGGIGGVMTAASGGTGGALAQGGNAAGAAPAWGDSIVDLKELDLGEIDMHVFAEFPIPSNTLGFTVLTEASTVGGLIGIYRLKPSGGSSVILNYGMAGKDLQAFIGLDWAAASNPQADSANAWPIMIGDWAVVVAGDGTASSARTRVWARRTADGQFHGGEVDFNVFIAPGTVNVIYAKTVLEQLFATQFGPKLGLTLGAVMYTALSPDSVIVDTHSEYRALLASSAGIGSVPAVNLFVVGDFDDAVFESAIGLAGGVPGAPMLHGTTLSGVAFQASGDVDADALVLAHEIGHLGGLFHTTEFSGVVDDPLSDTVICDYEVMSSDPSSCPDIDNIMFPMAAGGQVLSPAQVQVMRGSALYRGIVATGGQPAPPLPELGGGAASSRRWRPLRAVDALGKPLAVSKRRAPHDELERLLGGHWCARGHGYEKAVMAVARRSAPGRLVELVSDVHAFDLVRARALRTIVSAGRMNRWDLVELSKRVLASAATGRQLAVAAIGVLAERDPAALKALEPALVARDDLVIRQHLQGIVKP